MSRYSYRPIRDFDQLRPGEQAAQFRYPNPVRAWQGSQELTDPEISVLYALRNIPFRSRISTK